MSQMHLKQPAAFDKPGFTCSAFGPFTRSKERIQKFKETGDTSYIYKMNLIRLIFKMIRLMEVLKI